MQQQFRSRVVRAGLRKFSSSAQPQQPQAPVVTKQRGVRSIMLNDFGNFPLIAANTVGAIALTSFGLRKLFFHPDVGISEVNRFSNEICNETVERLDSSKQFRSQTRMFASILQPLSSPIMSLVTGTPQGYGDETDQWGLQFIRNREVMEPALENTNFFEDGLFSEVQVSEFAKNEKTDY